jgi:hypothetical protein
MPPSPAPSFSVLDWIALAFSIAGCALTVLGKIQRRVGLGLLALSFAVALYGLRDWLNASGWHAVPILPGFSLGVVSGVGLAVTILTSSWLWSFFSAAPNQYVTWDVNEFKQGEELKQRLRAERNLKAISDFQDDISVDRIDRGSYAFAGVFIRPDPAAIIVTGTPSPFAGSDFEFHRLANGAIELIGFVTQQDAHTIHSSAADSSISLFTRRTSMATELEAIPIQRILSLSHHSVRGAASRLDIKLAAPKT